jgi:hypothetical protein
MYNSRYGRPMEIRSYIVVEAGKKQEAFDDFPTRALAKAWAKKSGIRNYSIVLVESAVPQRALPRPKPLRLPAKARHKKNRVMWPVALPQPAPQPPPPASPLPTIRQALVRLLSGEEPPPLRAHTKTNPRKSRAPQKKFWCPKCAKRQRNAWCQFHGKRNKLLTPSLKAIVGPAQRKPYHGSVRHPYQGGLPQ